MITYIDGGASAFLVIYFSASRHLFTRLFPVELVWTLVYPRDDTIPSSALLFCFSSAPFISFRYCSVSFFAFVGHTQIRYTPGVVIPACCCNRGASAEDHVAQRIKPRVHRAKAWSKVVCRVVGETTRDDGRLALLSVDHTREPWLVHCLIDHSSERWFVHVLFF
jgi:hypothetical protein